MIFHSQDVESHKIPWFQTTSQLGFSWFFVVFLIGNVQNVIECPSCSLKQGLQLLNSPKIEKTLNAETLCWDVKYQMLWF